MVGLFLDSFSNSSAFLYDTNAILSRFPQHQWVLSRCSGSLDYALYQDRVTILFPLHLQFPSNVRVPLPVTSAKPDEPGLGRHHTTNQLEGNSLKILTLPFRECNRSLHLSGSNFSQQCDVVFGVQLSLLSTWSFGNITGNGIVLN